MKSFLKLAALAVSLCAAGVLGTGTTSTVGAQGAPPFVGGAMDHGMSWYYSGFSSDIGQFPGRLVCVNANKAMIDAVSEHCTQKHEVFVLSMSQDSMDHPLLPGTSQVRHELLSGKLLNKKVVVEGRYYPDTGMILAAKIRLDQHRT